MQESYPGAGVRDSGVIYACLPRKPLIASIR